MVMYSEFLNHQESDGWYFWRVNNIKKGKIDNFTGSKALSKGMPMY